MRREWRTRHNKITKESPPPSEVESMEQHGPCSSTQQHAKGVVVAEIESESDHDAILTGVAIETIKLLE